ncbi:hypothetical protein [Alkaliphilus hydrothermalis]|uniref:Uncharacterized protein n=1 Tax=Alkaliphilus hydrothermalis TaxID=1482730 RepID=A0ABS2NTI5_9FIRM|nr:hypothetical protein [Alkaliphilus hydrothermalis]MBM7616268.1 hypothetical protein [Alkaliphilus hydrothermalis]
MERESVRSLQKMPMKNKVAYCQLLTMMVKLEQPLDKLKIMELYRLMANIRIPLRNRKEVISFLLEGQQESEILCKSMMEDVNPQERNILRFSLAKDLMIIEGVNSTDSDREKEFLEEIEGILEISKDQKKFLEEEYKKDRSFYKDEEKAKLNNELQKETVATALALGIPLSLVYFSGYYWGMGTLGVLSGLEEIGLRKRTKRYSAAIGLGVTILTAFTTYHLVKGLWGYIRKNHFEIQDLIKEEMELIHQRALKYLEKDIEALREEPQQQAVGQLLMDTLSYMRKTRARII